MKKTIMLGLSLLLVLSTATFVAAEDRLNLDGEFWVRAFSMDNRNFNSDREDHAKYIDQRLRIGWRIRVMDGVAIRMRTDFQEDIWGLNTKLFGRPDDGNDPDSALQIDRAFLQINKPKFDFLIGHILQAWGTGSAYFTQEMGMALKVKTPVEVTLNYFKLNENGSILDEGTTDDKDMYAVMLAYPNSSPRLEKRIGAFFGMVDDASAADASPYMIGMYGNYNFNSLKLKTSLDVFGGDSATTDYMGAQFWLGLEYPFTKALLTGANFYYAKGAEEGETQLDALTTPFGGFAAGANERCLWGYGEPPFNIVNNGKPFDPVKGENTGVVGLDVFSIYKITPAWAVSGQVGYYAAEEDRYSDFDSMVTLTGAVKWTFAKGANILFAGNYASPDMDNNAPDDAKVQFLSILRVMY